MGTFPDSAWREPTALERERAQAFARCRFPVASFPKRFARELWAQLSADNRITDKQAACLERWAWKYRRQMPAELVPATKPEDVR